MDEYKRLFLELMKKVSSFISKCQSSDLRVCILANDCDSLAAASIVFYLIDSIKMPYSRAYALIKERRISVNIIER